MQNLEILDVFEILITQKLLKCPKDPFVRSALISYLNHLDPMDVLHPYQLYQSISVLRVVEWYYFLFLKLKENINLANSEDPDQTPRSVASDLGLHCLPMFH